MIEKIGNNYKFDFFSKSFYVTGISFITKSYEIGFLINYGNGLEWSSSTIGFDELEKYNFLGKVDIESLNITIKKTNLKYL